MKKKVESTFDLALQYLSYRSRTEAEVRAYLEKKGIETEETESVIIKLKYYHYIDDVEFLCSMVNSNYNGSQYGRRRLKMELQRRGIQDDVLSHLDLFFTDSMEENCLKKQFLSASRKYQDEPIIKRKQKISAYLQRRGFLYGEIASLISTSVFEDTPEANQSAAKSEDLKRYYEKYFRLHSRKGLNGRELNMRICRSLLSRGYPYDDVQDIISEYAEKQ